MKKSMLAKASRREDGVDRISSLPDAILELILSNLQGTEEAIRTSILSRRWRYLWTSLPSADIDYARGLKPSQDLDSNRFREFVSRVLASKSLDLDSFRLRCGSYYNMSTIGQWIDAAVMRKVKVVDLMFPPSKWYEEIQLPQCLVTCGSLEVLRLSSILWPLSLPKFTGFPALRVLELNAVELDNDNLVKYFLESCPLLEDLSLVDCFADSLVVISSPKLKNLRIDTRGYCCYSLEICCPKLEFLMLRGYVCDEYHFEGLDSLKKAVIHAQGLYKAEYPSDFFATISHVENLSISVYCIQHLFDSRVNAPISLPNLKTLELTVDHHLKMHVLIQFLKCVPNLESLHLIFPKNDYHLDMYLEEDETINILTRHLKKVEFLDFNGEKPKLDVARALLEHGNLLEEMVFSWNNEAKLHEMSMEAINQVSNFHKASSTVKLMYST